MPYLPSAKTIDISNEIYQENMVSDHCFHPKSLLHWIFGRMEKNCSKINTFVKTRTSETLHPRLIHRNALCAGNYGIPSERIGTGREDPLLVEIFSTRVLSIRSQLRDWLYVGDFQSHEDETLKSGILTKKPWLLWKEYFFIHGRFCSGDFGLPRTDDSYIRNS